LTFVACVANFRKICPAIKSHRRQFSLSTNIQRQQLLTPSKHLYETKMNAVLAGLPSCQIGRLQSIINDASRPVLSVTISLHCSWIFTGCVYLKALSSNCIRWRIAASMVQHLHTSLTVSSENLTLQSKDYFTRQ